MVEFMWLNRVALHIVGANEFPPMCVSVRPQQFAGDSDEETSVELCQVDGEGRFRQRFSPKALGPSTFLIHIVLDTDAARYYSWGNPHLCLQSSHQNEGATVYIRPCDLTNRLQAWRAHFTGSRSGPLVNPDCNQHGTGALGVPGSPFQCSCEPPWHGPDCQIDGGGERVITKPSKPRKLTPAGRRQGHIASKFQAQGKCTDIPNWEDADGDNCTTYAEMQYCQAGVPPDWSWQCAVDGVDAGGACCACGGGLVLTCADGVQNGGEIGVDCGGPCKACECPTSKVQLSGAPGQVACNGVYFKTSQQVIGHAVYIKQDPGQPTRYLYYWATPGIIGRWQCDDDTDPLFIRGSFLSFSADLPYEEVCMTQLRKVNAQAIPHALFCTSVDPPNFTERPHVKRRRWSQRHRGKRLRT